MDDPEARRELMDIAAQTGKAVEYSFWWQISHSYTNLSKVTVDETIRQNIHMDVVERIDRVYYGKTWRISGVIVPGNTE